MLPFCLRKNCICAVFLHTLLFPGHMPNLVIVPYFQSSALCSSPSVRLCRCPWSLCLPLSGSIQCPYIYMYIISNVAIVYGGLLFRNGQKVPGWMIECLLDCGNRVLLFESVRIKRLIFKHWHVEWFNVNQSPTSKHLN